MSAKHQSKNAKAARRYFDSARNYDGIAVLEHEFFSLLLSKRNELSGVTPILKALKDAQPFLNDCRGATLEVVVDFTVADTRRKKNQTMFLGTKLTPKASSEEAQVTHCICIAEDSEYLSKIHLDRDLGDVSREKKPNPHMQVGGRLIPKMKSQVTGEPFWKEDVDKPRIPSLPFCTVLLWHWAFMEFPCDKSIAPFLAETWWKTFVRKAEKEVLEPFFADGSALLTRGPASGLLQAFYEPLDK